MSYYRLSGMEKAAATTAFSIMAIIASVLLFFTFIFVNIFIAILLSYWFSSWTIGFGIFSGSYLLITALLLVFWRRIQRFMYNRFVTAILETLDDEED
ncbi:MAG: phage holin family protein [Sphingobacteriales bacterium]|nr:phage holin family protein [Sphingobacteriales bacterium]